MSSNDSINDSIQKLNNQDQGKPKKRTRKKKVDTEENNKINLLNLQEEAAQEVSASLEIDDDKQEEKKQSDDMIQLDMTELIKSKSDDKLSDNLQNKSIKQVDKLNESYLSRIISDAMIKNVKTINKDIDLKILGKMLYNKKNYYCELECKLLDNSYYEKYKREEISDIDIYGVSFDNSLQKIKIGFECKSTLNNGVDEILKIKGIQAYNELDIVGLLKKKVANNVRLIAEKIDVEVYDEHEITKIVSMLIEEYQVKFNQEKQIYILGQCIETQLKNAIKGVVTFIKATNWTNKPYQNIHTIVRVLEHIRDNKQLTDYQYMYISIKLSILLSLAFLEICSNIIKTNLSNVEQAALDQVFGGATERWEKSRTYDLISQELNKKVSPYPYYTKDYLSIISWIISSINHAGKISLCLEEYLKCYLLNIEYSSLNLKFSDETLKLTKDILRFVSKILEKNDLFKTIYKI